MFGAVRVVRSRKFVVSGFALQSWFRHAVLSIPRCMGCLSVGMVGSVPSGHVGSYYNYLQCVMISTRGSFISRVCEQRICPTQSEAGVCSRKFVVSGSAFLQSWPMHAIYFVGPSVHVYVMCWYISVGMDQVLPIVRRSICIAWMIISRT